MSETNNASNQKPSLSWSQTPPPAPTQPVTPPPQKPSASKAAAPAEGSNVGAYVSIFVAGIVIGALIGWGITSARSGGTPSATMSTSTMTETGTGTSTSMTGTTGSTTGASDTDMNAASIVVPSPQQAGFAVAISKMSVSEPTWLVVYEDHNGTPGNAIGAGLFFAGNTSGTVELLRATLPGQSYLVGESLDDGDKIFSIDNDKPVRDSKGNPIFTEFMAE